MEEFDFLGVSEDTKEQVTKSLQKVDYCNEKYALIDEFCQTNFGMSFAEFGALQVRSAKELGKNLMKARNEAALESDKKEIEDMAKYFLPIDEFSQCLGENLLDMTVIDGLEGSFGKDPDIDELIGACLV
jgi:hypothetical protein